MWLVCLGPQDSKGLEIQFKDGLEEEKHLGNGAIRSIICALP